MLFRTLWLCEITSNMSGFVACALHCDTCETDGAGTCNSDQCQNNYVYNAVSKMCDGT